MTLPIVYSQGVMHYMYAQVYEPNESRWSRALVDAEDRTLFLVNVPPDATTRDLVRIFASVGIVEKCVFSSDEVPPGEDPGEAADESDDSDSDTSMNDEQDSGPKITPLPMHDIRRLHATGQTAYCVFIDKVTLDRALIWMHKSTEVGVKWPKVLSTEAPIGFEHYLAKHRSLRPPLAIVKEHADTSLEAYEDRKAKAERPKNATANKGGPIVDEDGFTLVTRKGKPSRTGHAVMTKDFQNAIQHGEENDAAIRMRKHQEKLHKKDFYTFQTREKRRKGMSHCPPCVIQLTPPRSVCGRPSTVRERSTSSRETKVKVTLQALLNATALSR